MKILISALLIFSSFSITAFAQGGGEYTVNAVKGEYVIIGDKPYKILSKCDGLKPQDKVSFSESPITGSCSSEVDMGDLSPGMTLWGKCLGSMTSP